MSDTIVKLQTRPLRTNAECITILRDYLAKAEAGEIIAVAIAALEPDGGVFTQCSATDQFHAVLGAVTLLQHRMIVEQTR